MSVAKPVVAAFDFDGTLTTRDTLIPFLYFHAGPLAFAGNMIRSAPALAAYATRLIRNDVAKERVLVNFLEGLGVDQLEQTGKAFAGGSLQRLVRPQALRRLHWHQRQGHRVVIISASLDLYVKPWAASVGVGDVLCSSLDVDSGGRSSGRLQGANCFGPEKLNRLQDWLGDRSGYVLYAYGDSRGDRELLASADYSFYRTLPEEQHAAE